MNRTEIITRADGPATAELAPGVAVCVMATGSMGAVGVTTSLATFAASAELPYHQHAFSEVIVVVSGEALVLLRDGDTYCIHLMRCTFPLVHRMLFAIRRQTATLCCIRRSLRPLLPAKQLQTRLPSKTVVRQPNRLPKVWFDLQRLRFMNWHLRRIFVICSLDDSDPGACVAATVF